MEYVVYGFDVVVDVVEIVIENGVLVDGGCVLVYCVG